MFKWFKNEKPPGDIKMFGAPNDMSEYIIAIDLDKTLAILKDETITGLGKEQ